MKLGVWAETFSDLVREHGFPEWICSGAAIVAVATGVLFLQRGGSALPSSVTLTLIAAAVIPWLLARLTERLAQLVQTYAAAGLDVRIVTRGEPVECSAMVVAELYRIVQESLTNVLRHASGNWVPVEVTYDNSVAPVRVSNRLERAVRGRRAGTYRGRGILGMNERAHLLGGRLDAGPRSGLWVVQREVPDGGPTTTDVPPPQRIESVS